MKRSRQTAVRILDLDPSHGFARLYSKVLPYTCSASPDNILKVAIAFDQSLEPDNPVRWVTLTWLGMLHLNRGEFELALDAEQRAAQVFQTPDTVMRHAVILNALGRSDDAAELIIAQKPNWPNIDPAHFSKVTMPRRCHENSDAGALLGYYIDLTDAMAERLSK